MTVPASNTARLLWAIDRLVERSEALHAADEQAPLSHARFVEALAAPCGHVQARHTRRVVWAMVAAEAGVLDPDSRVRRQVLDYLAARSNAA